MDKNFPTAFVSFLSGLEVDRWWTGWISTSGSCGPAAIDPQLKDCREAG
jgi:hypothetical protein